MNEKSLDDCVERCQGYKDRLYQYLLRRRKRYAERIIYNSNLSKKEMGVSENEVSQDTVSRHDVESSQVNESLPDEESLHDEMFHEENSQDKENVSWRTHGECLVDLNRLWCLSALDLHPVPLVKCPVTVRGYTTIGVIDTGANVSLILDTLCQELDLEVNKGNMMAFRGLRDRVQYTQGSVDMTARLAGSIEEIFTLFSEFGSRHWSDIICVNKLDLN